MAEYVRLDEACEIKMGQSPDSNSYNENGEGLPFFQGNADFGDVYPETRVWCSSPVKIVEPETLLISVRAPIGALNFAKDKSCIGRGLAGISPKESYRSKYIYFCLKNKKNELMDKGTGSTFKAIAKNALGETLVRKIPLAEQDHIVKILSNIQSVIVSRKKEITELDDLIKARFVEMFGDPETNTFHWEVVHLNDVCSSVVRGPFGSALKKEFFVPKGENTYKVYEQKHAIQKDASLGTYYITSEKYQELHRFECNPGDILMSCSGTMGELYTLPEECEKGIINQALCKFTLNNRILPRCFIEYMQQTIGHLRTQGSGIKNIAAIKYVKELPINLPPIDVQVQFVDFANQVDKSKVVAYKLLNFALFLTYRAYKVLYVSIYEKMILSQVC